MLLALLLDFLDSFAKQQNMKRQHSRNHGDDNAAEDDQGRLKSEPLDRQHNRKNETARRSASEDSFKRNSLSFRHFNMIAQAMKIRDEKLKGEPQNHEHNVNKEDSRPQAPERMFKKRKLCFRDFYIIA